MPNVVLLVYYCVLILIASIVGGMIPVWFQLTHRRMQFAVSFVAGVMLGVSVLHMLPHAVADALAAGTSAGTSVASQFDIIGRTMVWLLTGMLAMFFIERFFSYHQHGVSEGSQQVDHHDVGSRRGHQHNHEYHLHDLSWGGAAMGLALHSVLNGVALAAAVQHGGHGSWLAGFGTFLVVFLHKPFDAMTIGMLMAHGGWSLAWRHTINALFAMAIPVGTLLFYFGLFREESDPAGSAARLWVAYALAFSAGTFLCISLSDLLPELQFHQHDRVKLSFTLVLGLGVAYTAGLLEAAAHAAHAHTPPSVSEVIGEGRNGENDLAYKTPLFYQRYATVTSVVSVQSDTFNGRKAWRKLSFPPVV
ncbi:MAG: ZIP family metal transporter [Planctomycetes bacterium]|nr:ZIP family metal transporter [Planctomycetota bacterium]